MENSRENSPGAFAGKQHLRYSPGGEGLGPPEPLPGITGTPPRDHRDPSPRAAGGSRAPHVQRQATPT